MDQLAGLQTRNSFADKWIGGHATAALVAIVILTLLVVFLIYRKYSAPETFMPTVTMYSQELDGTGQTTRGKLDPNVIPVSDIAPELGYSEGADTVAPALGTALQPYAQDCSGITMHQYDPWSYMLNVAQEAKTLENENFKPTFLAKKLTEGFRDVKYTKAMHGM